MPGAPPGGRSNGLPVRTWWAPLGRIDPRTSIDVLTQLADADIAAYTRPDSGTTGSYLEVRPPTRPMDLLYVEGDRLSDARAIASGSVEDNQDATFAAIVAGFHDLPATASWPASEDAVEEDSEGSTDEDHRPEPPAASYRRTIRSSDSTQPGLLDPGGLLGDEIRQPGDDPFPDDDEHFVPPTLGKAPPIRLLTRLAILAIAAGVALVVAPQFWGFDDTSVAAVLGAALIVGGVVRLLGGLRDEPDDDHPQDGAVV